MPVEEKQEPSVTQNIISYILAVLVLAIPFALLLIPFFHDVWKCVCGGIILAVFYETKQP